MNYGLHFMKLLKATHTNRLGVVAILLALTTPLRAQDYTIAYSTTDPGVTRSITNWGLDTGWPITTICIAASSIRAATP